MTIDLFLVSPHESVTIVRVTSLVQVARLVNIVPSVLARRRANHGQPWLHSSAATLLYCLHAALGVATGFIAVFVVAVGAGRRDGIGCVEHAVLIFGLSGLIGLHTCITQAL